MTPSATIYRCLRTFHRPFRNAHGRRRSGSRPNVKPIAPVENLVDLLAVINTAETLALLSGAWIEVWVGRVRYEFVRSLFSAMGFKGDDLEERVSIWLVFHSAQRTVYVPQTKGSRQEAIKRHHAFFTRRSK
jgi:hypothetical protein